MKKSDSSPQHTPTDPEAEFRQLFWKARNAHSKAGKNVRLDAPAHQAAVAFAHERKWTWAEQLLTALYHAYRGERDLALDGLRNLSAPQNFRGEVLFLEAIAHHRMKAWDAAIRCYRAALESPGFGAPGNAWNNLGLVLGEKKEYDAAIDACRKALAAPGYDTTGAAWNNLGNAFAEKKEYDAAIEAYRKALAVPGFDTPGNVWFNLGRTYAEMKKYDAAIEAYRMALKEPDYDTPGNAWNNLGSAFYEKKEYDAAIEAQRKALEIPDHKHVHLTRLNLALILTEQRRLDEAQAEITRVLAEPDTETQHARARLIASMLDAKRREIAPKPDEKALAAPTPVNLADGPEGRMKNALLRRETRYDEYLKRAPDSPRSDELTILRGWSSSVTLLEGGRNRQWRGGGYFLKWRGHGLIIDPGFDFLDNFHDAGFHGSEISAVVVSHNHPDHNHDLGSIDDLSYELFRRAKDARKTLFALDEDTAKMFPDGSSAHRGSACKLTRSDSERKKWLGGPDDGLPFVIKHFPVSHGADVPHAVGLKIDLLGEKDGKPCLCIGYTGDGEYTPELVKNLQGVDLLIAHVSQPDVQEFNEPQHLKKVHLGYNGLIRLLTELNPKPRLTLVGEFWAGLADLRFELIEGIRLRSGVPTVLPACLGFRLHLPDLTVRCTRTGQQVASDKVKVAPPIQEFGELGYLAPDSIL